MFHANTFNPAAVGESNLIEVIGQHRLNMVSMPGGGSTTAFSINSPIKAGKNKSGLGFSILDDKVGWFNTQSAHLQYAYKRNLGDGHLSVGTELGFVSLGFSGDSVAQNNITSEYYSMTGDDAIPQTSVIGLGFDVGIGLWYTADKWYIGLSFLHANQPTVKWGLNSEFKQLSSLYVTGGYDYTFDNQKFSLKPSILVKSDFNRWQFDLSSRLEYDNKFWGGLTLRPFNTVVLFAGMNINGGLSLGYSFDVATSRLITTNFGSHEILLSYSFEYVFSKQNSKYKSIRYL
jgi:type IX secretion system PorP/SprF family membrane protein